jgi:hypothetical protein
MNFKESGSVYDRKGNKALGTEKVGSKLQRHTLSKVRSSAKKIRSLCILMNHGSIQDTAYKTSLKTRKTFLIRLLQKLKGHVVNVKLVFLCKKDIADAHEEMNGDGYEKNFVVQLPANLLHLCTLQLTAAKRRYITTHHILFEEEMLKEDLTDLVNSVRWK